MKVTKKQIRELFKSIKHHEKHLNWDLYKAGAFIKDDSLNLYLSFHGQDLNEHVYHGTYDAHVDLTEIYLDDLTAALKVDEAYNLIQDMIEEKLA